MCIRAGSTPLESSSLEGVIRAFMTLVGLRSRLSTAGVIPWGLYPNFPSAYCGLMPGPSGHDRELPGTGDLSEVLHLS